MATIRTLAIRNLDTAISNPLDRNLIVVVLALILVSLICVGLLLFFRSKRRARKQAVLPMYNNEHLAATSRSHHRRTASSLTIPGEFINSQSQSNFVYHEKMEFVNGTSSPPPHALPQIRIHFPEETDDAGKRSSRVVVVRVGENEKDVGLEPVEETLPPYQQNPSDRFHSLDLDRIGGLKEKGTTPQ